MKTRNEIYQAEAATLLRIIMTYHTVTLNQALKLFPKKEDTIRTLIRKLIKQKRLYFDEEKNLLCDRPEAAESPDRGMIASLWVLLDFKKSILHHVSSDFPVKITFFGMTGMSYIWSESLKGRSCQRTLKRLARFTSRGVGERKQ